MQDGKLQFVMIKDENVRGINQAFSYDSSISEVVTYPSKIMPALNKLMNEVKVTTEIRNWITEVMGDAEFVAKLKIFEENLINNDQILEPIKQTLIKMRDAHPEQQDLLKQQLIKNIQDIEGKLFEGKFYYENGNAKISALETPLGKIFAEKMPKLPENKSVQMEVLKVSLGNKLELLQIINDFGEQLTQILSNDNKQAINLWGVLQNSNNEKTFLAKMLSPLVGQSEGNEFVINLLQKVVGFKDNVLINIYNFYKAAQSGKAKELLGDSLYNELKLSSTGDEVLHNIEQLLQSSLKETPLWKTVEFPFFDGSQLFNWKISVKKNYDEEEQKQLKHRNEEVRFVIDTEFSKLGAFQFDGFALKKQKRFDLIIRTSLNQSEDFCANIINLFMKSLSDLDYSGTIKINQKEDFLKPYTIETKSVDGVYI
jgi:hypothetical protein